MALTIVEASKKYNGDVIRQATIEMFARQSDILAALPFESIPGGAVKYEQEGVLPGVAFRGVNEAFLESTGVLNPQIDSVYIMGGDIDVDKYLIATRGMSVRAVQTAMKIKAIADAFNLKFIKGSNAGDNREFDGLQARVVGAQKIAAGSDANGTPLSLLKLDELIDAVDNPTHLIMSKTLARGLTAAARTPTITGYITYTPGMFGQRIMNYNGIPILTTNNGSSDPLTFTEAATSGTATASSIYCVSMGSGRLTGIQNGDMQVRDLGEMDTKPVMRMRVEWYAGLAIYHGRAVARLWSISNAAVTA